MVYIFLIEFAESLVYSPVNATGVVVLEPHWTKPSHGLDMESVKLNEAYKGLRFAGRVHIFHEDTNTFISILVMRDEFSLVNLEAPFLFIGCNICIARCYVVL